MVSREQVEHVARLAKLSVSAAEAEQLAGELGAVLDYVAQLDQLEGDAAPGDPTARAADTQAPARDARAIPPTDAGETHVAVVPTPRRPDEVRRGLRREDALKLAPASDGETFRVPPVIEGEGSA